MDDDEIEARRGRKMSFLAAALWSLLVGLVASLLVGLTESLRPGAMADVVNLTVCRVAAYSLFLFVILRIYTPRASIRDVLALRPVSPVAALFALAGGIALYPGLSLIDDAVYKRFPLGQEDTELLDQITQVTSLHQRIILLVSFALVIPVADEIFFNGVLFRGIRRGQAEGLAIVGVAALWAISRGDDYRLVPTGLILGLFTAWLRGRSGSLVPSLLAHVGMNAVPLVPIAFGKGDFEFGWKLAVGGVLSAAACAWATALVLRADDRAEEARLLDT